MKDLDAPKSIERGLVIREPWISHILAGRKIWEMRGRPTKNRGLIGLIRQGSGQIFGVAELVDSLPSLNRTNYGEHAGKHAIPAAMLDEVIQNGWVYPWVLSSVRRLSKPVPYNHKSGAVNFVRLEPVVSREIMRQLANDPT